MIACEEAFMGKEMCVGCDYIVPGAVIIFLRGFDLDFVLANVEGVHELALAHEECHEVVLALVRRVED